MLKAISDKLSYLDFPSKVILYQQGNQAILIDAGLEGRTARKVIKELNKQEMYPTHLILTHAHADHFGGAAELKEKYPDLIVLGSAVDQPIFEHPEYEPYYLYSAQPLTTLQNKFLMGEAIQIDQVLQPDDELELAGETWRVVDLSGHTPGQLGLITPDQILLTADAFFPEKVVEKYRLLYHFDLGKALQTLQRLERLAQEEEFTFFVPGHGEPLTSLQNVLVTNLQSIHATMGLIQQMIVEPMSREEIVQRLIQEYQIKESVTQYYLTISTVSAYLSYLEEQEMLQTQLIDGRLLFQGL